MNDREIENRGIEANLFNNIVTGSHYMPALQTFGTSLMYLGEGIAALKMTCKHEYANHMGSIHGAIVSGLLDNAMGYSIETLNKRCVTLEMNINYISPVMEGTEVFVEGQVIYAGKKTVVAESALFNNEGILAAKARGTFFVLPGTIEERIW